MRHTIALRCGTLTLNVEETEYALEELCGFGTRRSRKRGSINCRAGAPAEIFRA